MIHKILGNYFLHIQIFLQRIVIAFYPTYQICPGGNFVNKDISVNIRHKTKIVLEDKYSELPIYV
jgi:hypothetical protein